MRRKKAVVNILSRLYKLGIFSFDVFLKLFDAQLQPVVVYDTETWGVEHASYTIEKLHLFAMKKMLGGRYGSSK